jgi:DNA mismatch repair protein MutL
MGKVRLLPDRVANQIAAGEVVERPAAVVKELVENALDAGATRIEVEFNHGGRSLISVEDNGSGMDAADARLCLSRHATSKIAEAVDLDVLASFGFRGEALPSIASVSKFTLQTREAGAEAGTEICVNAGVTVHEKACGRPVGTRIIVEHLFNSVPARRKFLKTDQTEAAHIISCVRLYALGCPGTAFTLREDGRVVFRSPTCTTFSDRVAEIFGPALAGSLIAIDHAEAGQRLHGLIGKPTVSRSSRHELVTFVNGRPVESRTVHYALSESYRDSLAEGRYPVAFVFFDCDPAAVDVNVHPAKREVRFRHEAQVRSFILRAVTQRLREFSTPAGAAPAPEPATLSRQAVAEAAAVYAAEPAVRPLSASVPGPAPTAAVPPRPAPAARLGLAWRFVGLAHGSYALFETPSGVVLLDRRAAHERIWYERLRAQFADGTVASQRLLLPISLELDPVASALVDENREFLGSHGLEIADFGRNFFRLESIPAWMEPADAEPFLRDLIGELKEGSLGPETDARHDEFAKLAASRAVRLPATASEAEIRQVAAQLHATASPLTSPSGRPTYVELSHGELARRFQR